MKAFFQLFPILLLILFFSSCDKKEKPVPPTALVSVVATVKKQETKSSGTSSLYEKQYKKNKRAAVPPGENFYRKLQNASEKFTLNPAKDTILKCAQGTLVEIKANAFLLNGKECRETVSLYIKECYRPEDMIFANLSTTSDDRLLESGGMLHLEAFAKNQPLTLDKNKTITLKMPTEGTKEYMQLFYATDKNGSMNWIQASDSKPQFAKMVNNKKSRQGNLRPGNYFFAENGIGSITTTVSILKNGKERVLSSTSYASSTLYQSTIDSLSLRFEIDANGIIKNTFVGDSISNKRSKVTVHRLESINSNSLIFYPYTPGSLRFMDCALLFNTGTGIAASPSFIVPRLDYSTIKKKTGKNETTTVIVRNSYVFISRGGQSRAKEIKEKLDSAGNNLSSVSSEELEYYVFNINQMGWINCDRFYNVPASQKINFAVANAEGADLKMVFDDIRSVMKGFPKGDRMTFDNVPENKNVTLISIRVKGDKAELAILKTTTKKVSEDKLEYVTVTLEELKNKVKMAL